MSNSVEVEKQYPLAVLTLKRPPVNALDEDALTELMEKIDKIDRDPDVRVVLLTSGIAGIFCAGGDLKYWPKTYPTQADVVSAAGRAAFGRIERLSKPSIAVIHGHVSGDGLSLALACDLRVAADDSTFLLPELDYGFIPGWGTIGRLSDAIGKSATAELLLVGEPIRAERAQAIGLINMTKTPGEVATFAHTLAIRISEKPRVAMHYAKAALNGNSQDRSTERTDWEIRCFSAVWGGKEWKNGLERLFGLGDLPDRR